MSNSPGNRSFKLKITIERGPGVMAPVGKIYKLGKERVNNVCRRSYVGSLPKVTFKQKSPTALIAPTQGCVK